MGMDTEQFKVGDKVKALCGPIGHERERDCVVVELRADGKYAVNAEMLGQFYLHFVDADKVWVERAAEPAKEAQTPVEVKEALEKLAPYNDHTVEVTEKDIAAINQAIDTLGAVKFSSKTVEPPADPPKPERIRRTKEEIALGVPHKDILAYRADPEGWLKKEREATDSFHEVIEQAKESHWEDKAKEILEPEETGRQVFERLGWKRIADDSDATIAYTWDRVSELMSNTKPSNAPLVAKRCTSTNRKDGRLKGISRQSWLFGHG